MFSIAKKMDPKDAGLVGDYLARGGTITQCPPRKASSHSPGGWSLKNDRSRAELGRAVG